MKHKRLKISVLLLLGLGLTGLQAQNAIPATGGNASGSGGSASYSVGQVVYTTTVNLNGTVSQGIQQPYEIYTITGIKEIKEINLFCSAYPNPTTDLLNLKVDATSMLNIQSMNYQLFDIRGKLIETKKLDSSQISIDTKNLIPATYFLKIMENNKEIKTFKIIKN